jgi:NAD(P)-dependent dehydrogenase (short-subunit alcohol dehydrogenase family)
MNSPPEHSNGKVAIITGSSQGIGAGLTKAYRQRGFAVIATARSIELSEDAGIVAVQGDIADPDTAQRIVDTAIERFGRIDTLINNAGIYIGKSFTDYTIEDFNALIAVNLPASFTSRRERSDTCSTPVAGTWSTSRRASSSRPIAVGRRLWPS